MKKKIIFGRLLAVFLMMMLPTSCAVEYSIVKETIKSQNPIIIPDLDVEELKKRGLIFKLLMLKFIVRNIRRMFRVVVLLIIIKRIFGNNTAIIS